MSDAKEESLFRERELAFFGEVTASVSHELNNAIAIIEQTSGLLEDLIAAGDPDASIPKKKLQTIVDRVGKQTKRGAMIVRRLNAFAHSVESTKREIELQDLSQCVIALSHRMAERKRTELVARPTDRRIVITANSFRVQEALYLSIQKSVSILPEGSRIEVGTGEDGATAWICVEGQRPDAPAEAELGYLEKLMGELNGELESNIDEDRIVFRLRFPLS